MDGLTLIEGKLKLHRHHLLPVIFARNRVLLEQHDFFALGHRMSKYNARLAVADCESKTSCQRAAAGNQLCRFGKRMIHDLLVDRHTMLERDERRCRHPPSNRPFMRDKVSLENRKSFALENYVSKCHTRLEIRD